MDPPPDTDGLLAAVAKAAHQGTESDEPGRPRSDGGGVTSKGPWRSSKNPGIQQALSNAYLKSQGLFALRDGWIRLHHSK